MKTRQDPRVRRNNILLALLLGGFALLVLFYSMSAIWPHIDIFRK